MQANLLGRIMVVGIEQFGYGCYMEEKAAVIEDLNCRVVEKAGLKSVIHDLKVAMAFWQLNKGLVDTDLAAHMI